MAKLWGTSSTQEQKPVWLTDAQKENCYATKRGWVIKRSDGTEEVLVAIAGLSLANKLGTATITSIVFPTGTYRVGNSKTVRVQFNEKVTVTGTPTLLITGSIAGNITASYSSMSTNGTTMIFTFTVPAAGNILSVGAQSVASGTITETGVTPTVNADRTITSAVSAATLTVTAAP